MALRRITRGWIVALVVGVLAGVSLQSSGNGTASCLGGVGIALAILSCLALAFLGFLAAFRAIVRRLTLRLAFSYFLIGVVPIPLLALLLFACGYLTALQIVATRVRREVSTIGMEGARAPDGLPRLRIDADGTVAESDLPALAPGSSAPWAKALSEPRPLIVADDAWLVTPVDRQAGRFVLIPLTDSAGSAAHRLSELTGYVVAIQAGKSSHGRAFRIDVNDEKPEPDAASASPPAPTPAATTGKPGPGAGSAAGVRSGARQPGGVLDARWIAGVYLDRPLAELAPGAKKNNVVIFFARTSPRLLFRQLFAQGIPEIGKVFWGIVTALAAALLLVYLGALAIAFTLVGSIARNVNRLTRASLAIARGDFSVRVNSGSRDQIGDLARSFDGMAASIERLLLDTARKERLEGEIAIARTIQQKLLPAPDARLPGLCLQAHFEPLAEIGGDYYDYAVMPDGRSAVVIGDVSGHGLSTGLLVAMAKAGLSTLLESGLEGTPLFIRLNDLIYRSTDSRNYMTLALFAYEPATGRGTLTNAGQLAPYRLTNGKVESLSLPSFPLGASPRKDFPTREWRFAPGDRIVFSTDGIVEAADVKGEPFGFERLEALLLREANSTPSAILEAILGAIAAHTGGAVAEDDRTLVVVEVEK